MNPEIVKKWFDDHVNANNEVTDWSKDMSEVSVTGFTTGSKYATISKDFYRDIINDLERIKTSIGLEDTKANAEALIKKLKAKYEPPYDVASKLKQADAAKLQGSI
jgi:hypothetical protein